MGTGLSAIFSHQINNSTILGIPDFLNADAAVAKALTCVQTFPDRELFSQPHTWFFLSNNWIHPKVDDENERKTLKDNYNHYPILRGPFLWSIDFRENVYKLSIHNIWHTFVDDIIWQTPIRQYCFAVMNVLGASRAIYVPSNSYRTSILLDWFAEDLSFEQLEVRALRYLGLPARLLTPERSSILQNGVLSNILQKRAIPDNLYNSYFIDHFSDLKNRTND